MKTKVHPTTQYAQAVIKGKILTCAHTKLACQRHLDGLAKMKGKAYPYYFDEVEADRWYTLFGMLNFWKGEWAGQPFKLELWQKFIIGNIFGWRHKLTKLRKYRKAYIDMARKNAKTTLAAGIAIGILAIDCEAGAQVYAAATKEMQARIVVNDTAQIIKGSPEVQFDDNEPQFEIYELRGEAHRLIHPDSGSFMTSLGRDSKNQDGFDVMCGIIDEYHAHVTDKMLDVLESGTGARSEPLIFIITTAGFNKQGPCFSFRRNAIDVLQGIKNDDELFAIIYSLDDGDDWQDPAVWGKANPNLGVSVKLDFLKGQCNDAMNRPSKLVAFQTKNLNLWVDAPDVWIPDNTWMACADHGLTLASLKGEICYTAIDLASTNDITCAHFLFPHAAEKMIWIPVFFCPKETAALREQEHGVPYTQWAKDGYLILTDGGGGKICDYNYIKKFCIEIRATLKFKTTAFDRWNSSQLVIDMRDEGFEMNAYAQTMANMSYPTKEFEKLIVGSKMLHDGNPVMQWMMKNVAIIRDSNDNIKIDKKKSIEKVDGPVSAVMVLGEYLTQTATVTTSVYETRGIRTL